MALERVAEVVLRVPSGMHGLDVRVDGSRWLAPAGTTHAATSSVARSEWSRCPLPSLSPSLATASRKRRRFRAAP